MSDFKIDFIIIGAQKCGTTFVANVLADHPAVCFSQVKEPFYFNRSEERAKGLEEYHRLFAPKPGQRCGEASTHYTFLPAYPDTAEAIRAYNPGIKLIYAMRHPFERMLSLYTFKRMRHETKVSFEEDIATDPEYTAIGRYYTQLLPYLRRFDEEQILLLVFEELVADPVSSFRKVADFLEIDNSDFDLEKDHPRNSSSEVRHPGGGLAAVKNILPVQFARRLLDAEAVQTLKNLFYQRSEKPSYSECFRREMERMFELEIRAMEELMNRNLDVWRTGG